MSDRAMKAALEIVTKIVDTWHFETFHGSAAARDTEVWNLIHAAREDLKERLAKALAYHARGAHNEPAG